ncbi:hypothetical protein [Azovibrio restrictus]|uniref:hypothetical protein n=1 Tax=Azovibrio restrictus TaxID=146938 RepID=UPI0012EBC246|nr:hypothetical protein [Azovibrio restrictus]
MNRIVTKVSPDGTVLTGFVAQILAKLLIYIGLPKLGREIYPLKSIGYRFVQQSRFGCKSFDRLATISCCKDAVVPVI